MHLIMCGIIMQLPYKNLYKSSNDLMYREGNCQDGVITRIAVYVDELFEYKFLFVYMKMTKIDFSTFAIFFHLLN